MQLKLGCCCFCSDALVFLLRVHALLLLQLKLHALTLSLCLSSRRTEGSLGSLMGCNCLVQQRCSASVTHTRTRTLSAPTFESSVVFAHARVRGFGGISSRLQVTHTTRVVLGSSMHGSQLLLGSGASGVLC